MNRPVPKSAKEIVEVPIGKVLLWKDNPRKNDAAVPKVAEIFKLRGQINPVVVWKKNNVCYAGNTRLKAAKYLGWKTVKVLYVDFPSEQAAIAYGIADNKSSEWAEWDEGMLQSFLTTPEMIRSSGFSDTEKAALFFEPDLEKISKINESDSGLKDKIVVIILDASKRDTFREMLGQWIESVGIAGVEIK